MSKGGKPEELVKRLKYTLECSICMETYTDPRILDCVHSFCFNCIRTHIGNSTVIKCPLCNKQSTLPIGTGIEGLKSNFFIKGLIDDMMHTGEKNVESVPAVEQTYCGSCDLGKLAKSHCNDCDCELCDRCIQLHSQLKIFKLHKVTLYPTDQEIKAHKEAVVNKKVTHIQNNIAANISKLEAKMVKVQAKIKAVNTERDTTVAQVNEAYQRFLKQIESYVQGLTTRINQQAEKTLSQLPRQLKAYETQLTTFQKLEKQRICMLDMDLDKKVKLCKEFQRQIRKLTIAQAAHPGPSACMPKRQFVSENTKLEMEPILEQTIGFLTQIKSRYERKVDIHLKDMSPNMVDDAVECAHKALDKYGMDQSTEQTLGNIAKIIRDRYATTYNRGNWSCCVTKGPIGYNLLWGKFLHFSIDGYAIILMKERK